MGENMSFEERQRQFMISIVLSIIPEAETQRNNLMAYANTLLLYWKGTEKTIIQEAINKAISELNSAINQYYNILTILQQHRYE